MHLQAGSEKGSPHRQTLGGKVAERHGISNGSSSNSDADDGSVYRFMTASAFVVRRPGICYPQLENTTSPPEEQHMRQPCLKPVILAGKRKASDPQALRYDHHGASVASDPVTTASVGGGGCCTSNHDSPSSSTSCSSLDIEALTASASTLPRAALPSSDSIVREGHHASLAHCGIGKPDPVPPVNIYGPRPVEARLTDTSSWFTADKTLKKLRDVLQEDHRNNNEASDTDGEGESQVPLSHFQSDVVLDGVRESMCSETCVASSDAESHVHVDEPELAQSSSGMSADSSDECDVHCYMSGLSSEVQLLICRHMEVEDLSRLAQTCCYFANLIQEAESLWKYLCKRDFNVLTRGKNASYADLYILFYKVHKLAASTCADHLYKETDMLWLMASCWAKCPVERWETVASNKVRMLGLSLDDMDSSAKIVPTGQIGQGGRIVNHFAWRDVVDAMRALHSGSTLEVQKYLIRRCLNHRITSSVHDRYVRHQMDQREHSLVKYLAIVPTRKNVLLAGLYQGGLKSLHSQITLRDEAMFLIHPLLRMYRCGHIRFGAKSVAHYVDACDIIQQYVLNKVWCQRESMEIRDYSMCLCLMHKELAQQLETQSVSIPDMLAVAESYYKRIAAVWKWQTQHGMEYMWHHRPSCVITAHVACGKYLESGEMEYLDTLTRYFETREALVKQLDTIMEKLDECIPTDEITVLYVAMAAMPRPAFRACTTGAAPRMNPPGMFTCAHAHRLENAMPGMLGYTNHPRCRCNHGAGNGEQTILTQLHRISHAPCRYPDWVQAPTDIETLPRLNLRRYRPSFSSWWGPVEPVGYNEYQRTTMGWEYQELLRQWLRVSDTARRTEVYQDAYNLVTGLLNAKSGGEAASTAKLIQFVSVRYTHCSIKIHLRQCAIQRELQALRLNYTTDRSRAATPAAPSTFAKPVAIRFPQLHTCASVGALPSTTLRHPWFVSPTGDSLLWPQSVPASAIDGQASHATAALRREIGVPNVTRSTHATVATSRGARLGLGRSISQSNLSSAAHLDREEEEDTGSSTHKLSAKKGPARAASLGPSLMMSSEPSHNRGLIANTMIVTGYTHIDQDIHQYFCLCRDGQP
ncbi:uncharacterized protein LOC135815152 [Sycon ciliatum]|uniref:uncharacterized protein LOC135815152 n=1 Tax=Sycon ciliatum TaxID=27933 RepID=UPI0031F681E2